MTFPGIPILFILFIIFIVIYNYKINKVANEIDKVNKDFIERERKARFTRKKPLDNIKFIEPNPNILLTISQDAIDEDLYNQIILLKKDYEKVSSLKMASFRNKNNTDLKFQYGAANLNTLITFESTYNNLLSIIIKLANLLIEANKEKEAILLLEEGVRIESDFESNYTLLIDLYKKNNETLKLISLKEIISIPHLNLNPKLIKNIDNIIK